MELEMNNLKRFLDILVDRAVRSGFESVNIADDFYWELLSDERYKFDSEVPEPVVGSLIEDISHLNGVLNGTYEPSCLDFEILANILASVGENIRKSDKLFL